ncbi:MAG TPA: hypothetical protein PKI14_09295 [Fervidobacterium sp.]|nr:hypothetical protein [Fervidobacterium sp.]
MQNLKNIDEPLNVTERYLYNINIRLNILIEMMSSFLEAYAAQNNIAITNNKVVEKKVEKPKKKKKTE